jgi:hypothetical protein
VDVNAHFKRDICVGAKNVDIRLIRNSRKVFALRGVGEGKIEAFRDFDFLFWISVIYNTRKVPLLKL